jgi:DNA repair protein RecN (Recombination protein N)
MLKSLSIKNYALINDISIDFYNGLSIITGETGSGKSILLGALSLMLGERAETGIIRSGEEKCIVEGSLLIKEYDLQDYFNSNDIDYSHETIIRREINLAGKSRAFINDSPVNLNILKELGEKLIDIHSQHETLFLSHDDFQLQVIDAMAGNSSLLMDYSAKFKKFRKDLKELNELKRALNKDKSELDYLKHQFNELESVQLVAGEQIELENELEILSHSEEIKYHLYGVIELFNSDNSGILTNLKETISKLAKVGSHHNKIAAIEPGVNSAYIELKEYIKEIEHIAEAVELDPSRVEFVKSRLDIIYNLIQKHHVASADDLISLKSGISKKIEAIAFDDEHLTSLEKLVSTQQGEIEKLCEVLSEKRQNISPELCHQVLGILSHVGIPNAAFEVQFESLTEPGPKGSDKVKFLFSANKNQGVKELSKVASGGELSRFMLAIKSLVAGKLKLPTIIFDEIDSGVSGEIADKVGNIIKAMASNMQVLNITHLPQVASKGDYHYLVYKTHTSSASETKIKLLNDAERSTEIAKMLSGQTLTNAARVNADELLRSNKN